MFITGCFYAPALTITGVSLCSCVAHIHPVPPAQGRGCQRLLAAEVCNVCGDELHLWSRDQDTDPKMTRGRLRNPKVLLGLKREEENEETLPKEMPVLQQSYTCRQTNRWIILFWKSKPMV